MHKIYVPWLFFPLSETEGTWKSEKEKNCKYYFYWDDFLKWNCFVHRGIAQKNLFVVALLLNFYSCNSVMYSPLLMS